MSRQSAVGSQQLAVGSQQSTVIKLQTANSQNQMKTIKHQ